MLQSDFDTLSQATNGLTANGYTEGFTAEEKKIVTSNSKREYNPDDLKIEKSYRFEGMSNPQDTTIVMAIKAKDGTKGTLVMSYSAQHSQNVDLIKQIPNVS